MMNSTDAAAVERLMTAFMQMDKLEIAELEKTFYGEPT